MWTHFSCIYTEISKVPADQCEAGRVAIKH